MNILMKNDLISVIVPVYNIENYVKRCIESIAAQTYRNIEIIVIDDGSTDSSPRLCDSFNDDRITVIHKKNEGLGYARNTGLEVAKGKYVTFVDGDDAILENHIENMYRAIVDMQADTCLCGFTKVYGENRFVESPNVLAGKVFCNEDIMKYAFPRMLGNQPGKHDKIEMSAWSKMFSNEIIKKHNIRFPSEREFISEDIIFDYEYFPFSKKVVACSDVGYLYSDNPSSLTTKYNPNRFVLQKKLTLELLKRSKELGIENLCKGRIYNTFLGVARYSIKLEEKYSYQNGYKQTKRNVKKICSDPIIGDIMSYDELKAIPIKSRFVLYLIKFNCVNTLLLVMKIKNSFNI